MGQLGPCYGIGNLIKTFFKASQTQESLEMFGLMSERKVVVGELKKKKKTLKVDSEAIME